MASRTAIESGTLQRCPSDFAVEPDGGFACKSPAPEQQLPLAHTAQAEKKKLWDPVWGWEGETTLTGK